MKYLKIKNQNELDVRLISLMGGTTKTGNQFKIGRFGTGLKYVLAYLFRNNIDFKIFVGEKEVKLHTVKETILGTDFEIIYIDDNRTSITTQMGAEWEAWMIVRELWSNAMDEGKHAKEITEDTIGEANATTFYLQATSEINAVLDKWNDYFIHDETPMYSCDRFAIYSGGKDLMLYKQGVLIHKQENQHALFRYDIKDASINELRQYTGSQSLDVFKCFCDADEKMVDYILTNLTEQHWEGCKMDYSWMFQEYSETWKKVIGNAKLIHQKSVDTIQARGLSVDLEGTIIIPQKLFSSLTRQFDGISALRIADAIGEFYETHDEKLMQKVKQALTILESCDYFIHAELKFITGVFGDKKTLARVKLDSKEILISEQMLNSSLFDTCAMLVEENEHFNTGHEDCSRAFQQHFINMFTKKLLQLHAVEL